MEKVETTLFTFSPLDRRLNLRRYNEVGGAFACKDATLTKFQYPKCKNVFLQDKNFKKVFIKITKCKRSNFISGNIIYNRGRAFRQAQRRVCNPFISRNLLKIVFFSKFVNILSLFSNN